MILSSDLFSSPVQYIMNPNYGEAKSGFLRQVRILIGGDLFAVVNTTCTGGSWTEPVFVIIRGVTPISEVKLIPSISENALKVMNHITVLQKEDMEKMLKTF